MRFHILAVGRAKKGPERALYEHFAARILPPPLLREVEERRPLPPPELKKREASLLLEAMPAGSVLVALDEGGLELSSREFAARIKGWRDRGGRDLAFAIGGATGHDCFLRDRADLVLSLGAMTWPHMLVRGLLAEQLFRAQCINSGHPYHRE